MRVCIVTPEYVPNWGGVGTYCLELARALSPRVEVHVVTMARGQRLFASSEDSQSHVQVHTVAEASQNDTFFFNASFQLAVYKQLPRIVHENRIDLIHSNFPAMPDVLLKSSQKIKCPSLATIHTTISGQRRGIYETRTPFSRLDRSEKYTLLLYPLLSCLQGMYLRHTTRFLTVSHWMRLQLEKEFPNIRQASVIYRGIDVNRFRPNPRSRSLDRKVIVFSSRLTASKGIGLLIRAMPAVIRAHPDALFIFSGAGNPAPWQAMMSKLGIDEKHHRFLGSLDYGDVPNLYASAKIFVSVGLYENFPARILEAMSCGAVVVALNRGAIAEAIVSGENGVLIESARPDALSKAINNLLAHEDEVVRLSRNARRTITSRFSLSTFASETIQLYEDILSSHEVPDG